MIVAQTVEKKPIIIGNEEYTFIQTSAPIVELI